jgi:hypothetical protein
MKNWSRLYDCCIKCNTIEKRHVGKGLCVYCYLKQYYTANITTVKAQKNKHYNNKQKPLAKLKREQRYFNNNRAACLARDNNLCQMCFAVGDIVHHKDGQGRGSKTPNNLLSNLITLCRKCHLNIHRDGVLINRFKKGTTAWAKNYKCCTKCETVKIPHNANGLCRNCYMQTRRKL